MVDLQTHFSDDPEKFMEAVLSVDMSKRKEHLPDKEWRTRFMSSSTTPYPGASANAVKAERLLNQQASRTILADRFEFILNFFQTFSNFFFLIFN